jgi:hypothetical protein
MSRLMHPIAYEFGCDDCTPGGRLRWLCGLAPEQRAPNGNGTCPHAQPGLPSDRASHVRPGRGQRGKDRACS